MAGKATEKLITAKELLEDFSQRTGLEGKNQEQPIRYLWTDAFAVQSFFGLAKALKEEAFKDKALQLIEQVHQTLGRFAPADSRTGWISGMPQEEGKNHPCIGGLRIGKKELERSEDEAFNERLEWERDGQYFHYLTRWGTSLLSAFQETQQPQFGQWVAELILAGNNFIYKQHETFGMYWKMSIDLSRPLVTSMGAHDPLEGLMLTENIRSATREDSMELELLSAKFQALCSGMDWTTSDPLGIGGLLLNIPRSIQLPKNIPAAATPKKLLKDSHNSLRTFAMAEMTNRPAQQRLAFRECGLSLGLRVLCGMESQLKEIGLDINNFMEYLPMAARIEDFWSQPENQQAAPWKNHLDINSVSLAASLVASEAPDAFT